jgi:hypothetical protein
VDEAHVLSAKGLFTHTTKLCRFKPRPSSKIDPKGLFTRTVFFVLHRATRHDATGNLKLGLFPIGAKSPATWQSVGSCKSGLPDGLFSNQKSQFG